jgi:hypothetical protein
MKQNELALVVERERRRRATTWAAAARACRAQFAKVAAAPSKLLTMIAVLLRRLRGNSRTDGWTVEVMVAAHRRRWWSERIALPLAAVVLSGAIGAATALVING